jgi:hypothetical protein
MRSLVRKLKTLEVWNLFVHYPNFERWSVKGLMFGYAWVALTIQGPQGYADLHN